MNRSTTPWVCNLVLVAMCLAGCEKDADPIQELEGSGGMSPGATTDVAGTGGTFELGSNSTLGGVGTMDMGGTGQSLGGTTGAVGSGGQDLGGTMNVGGSVMQGSGGAMDAGDTTHAGGSNEPGLGGANAGGIGGPGPGGVTSAAGNSAQSSSGNSNVSGTDAGATCSPSDVTFKSISVGVKHTCGVTTEGTVRCWGDNSHGQLGDDTTETRPTLPPQDVLTDAKAVAAGDGFTCALTTAGGVRCWGDNTNGQLGLGQVAVPILSPSLVDVLAGVQSIAAGTDHVCALTNTGGVRCWGNNQYGQLGDGTSAARSTPPPSDVLTGAVAISAGNNVTCALIATSGVRCWGTYVRSDCPNGTHSCQVIYQRTPPGSDFLSDVQSVAAGDGNNAYAVHTNGNLEYWQGASASASVVLSEVAAMASAGTISCALMKSGAVRCWGSAYAWSNLNPPCYGLASDYDQCPVDSLASTIGSTPSQATDMVSGARAIAVGMDHACALMPSGGVQCWGNNQSGQLGDGTGTDLSVQYLPSASDVLASAKAIALGMQHTCALTSRGGVRCWGSNIEGQLGDGTPYYRDTPPPNDVIADVQAVAAGALHTCVLTTAGGVRCWGDNTKGQLGDGTTTSRNSPPSSDVLSGVHTIHANYSRTCVIMVDGGLRCWGDGVLSVPTEDVIDGAVAVASGIAHKCVLLETGGVRCWGRNRHGQLGDGTTTDTSAPSATDVLTGVQAIAAGEEYTCALTALGGMRCWGDNGFAELGISSYRDQVAPPDTDVLDEVQAISAGRYNACALTNAGAIRCWGDYVSGQRGDGYIPNWAGGGPITGDVLTGAQAVVSGYRHTCALTTAGGVRCWGDGSRGQLGDGRASYRATPVWVSGTCSQ